MIQAIKPKVTLVGAGPGDPELITLKGVFALNKADVVLYDALIDKALLKHAPDNAIKVFVGKRE
jgi:uroporphyrin-III C-methyltransferase